MRKRRRPHERTKTLISGFASAYEEKHRTLDAELFYPRLSFGLFVSVCNTSLCEVIGRQLDVHAIPHQDTDAVSAHTARDGREDDMVSVVDLYLKKSIWLFVYDHTRQFDQFFFHLYYFALPAHRSRLQESKKSDASGQVVRPEAIVLFTSGLFRRRRRRFDFRVALLR